MRSRMEIKEKFIELSRKIVREAFKKRKLMKMEFTGEEMEKIKEIDQFLRTVSWDNTDDLEKQFRSFKHIYFCVVVKMKIMISGKEMEHYVHHYIKMEDFDYEKCPFYIAKGIYIISKNKHAEIYFCVNGLKAGYTETGLCVPERKQKNVCMASSLFVDLDLKGKYAKLGNEELWETFERENKEFINCLLAFDDKKWWGYTSLYSNRNHRYNRGE